ncbi:WD40 repeat domain-containing protein [Stackebrandtia nassauensis]|uniref:WD40 repeat domain-containing protein n=1 Tax=Stackebrandtia nassauensis (strain DSM 44728 / CIP 108903 / NRRL B-16338 / NBRC 102104 / LLR-40K-21) TaxID=446470 RepID=D3PWI8_STANL|nr:hypothetical protein [Stackebrandtia nassauensis]ADD43210.1 hypothetical protein Snas_3548 [Stackebrandtia nassauensis DSM 44728]
MDAHGFTPPPDASAADAEAQLRAADWHAFDARRDLEPLRAALLRLEADDGVTDAHRFATERLRERGALLRHPGGLRGDASSHALSPDGRYFAIGSWTGDDHQRGTIQVWEVATARCVNVLDEIPGGVGWPERFRNLQWSADGRLLMGELGTGGIVGWDPFADRAEPTAAATVRPRRPVGFALSPDGSWIFLHRCDGNTSTQSGTSAGLVPVAGRGDPDTVPPPWWPGDAAPHLGLNGAVLIPQVSWFSAASDRVWMFGEWQPGTRPDSQYGAALASIDLRTGQLDWFVETELDGTDNAHRVALSPDESMLVLHHGDTLEFLHPATGNRLGEVEAPFRTARLTWTVCQGQPRLAVVCAEIGMESSVKIYEGVDQLCSLMQVPQPPEPAFSDGIALAWSPDGERAACLNEGGNVEIMTVGPKHDYVDYFDAPKESRGLWWGAGDVIIIAGPRNLMFRNLTTGETIGDFRYPPDTGTDRPLWDNSQDLGRHLHPDPTFAIDADRWVAAFPEGVVIAPSGAELLDHNLAWSIDRRHAWPYRWGPVEPAPGVAACFETLDPAARAILAPLRDRPTAEPVVEWPPPNTATVDVLYDAIGESFEAFSETWLPHVMDATRRIARQRARAGDVEAAETWLRQISSRDWDDYVRFKAEVALVLAANGNPRAGARLHCEAAIDASHGVSDSALPFVASAVGATFAALGHPERGQEWIQRAITAIDPDHNPWEHRIAVCWALLEGGLDDRARQLWTDGEDGEPADANGWLAHLIRIGRDDLMREILYDVGEDWYSFRDAVAVFTAAGRADLMREFFEYYSHTPDEEDIESLAEADRNAVTPRPNEFDIAELRHRRAELLRAPSSERRVDTIRLAWRAAAAQHYDAVLDMLKLLPYKDYDDQPETAVRSLWMALTGVDDDAW